MAKQRDITAQFPLAGLDRRRSYQNQPPFSTPEASNVRPQGPIEERMRGGSRPGLTRALMQWEDFANPIRMLATVTHTQVAGHERWEDDFSGNAPGALWSDELMFGLAPTFYENERLIGAPYTQGGTSYGLLSDAFAGGTAGYFQVGLTHFTGIAIYITPYQAAHAGDYYLYLFLDDDSPDRTTTSAYLRFSITGEEGDFACWCTCLVNGSIVNDLNASPGTTGSAGHPGGGWLEFFAYGTNLWAFWRGEALHPGTGWDITGISYAALGSRIAFTMLCSEEGGRCLIDRLRYRYDTSDTYSAYKDERYLVASTDGDLYVENAQGHLQLVESDIMPTDRNFQAVEYARKLYIANTADPIYVNAETAYLYWAATEAYPIVYIPGGDWTGVVNVDDHICVIMRSGKHEFMGAVSIQSIPNVWGLRLDYLPNYSQGDIAYAAALPVDFWIFPKQYVLNPQGNGVAAWEATTTEAGEVPPNCPLICRYRDRLVLAGEPKQMWYMSATGDPGDWNFFADSDIATRAVAGTLSQAGESPEGITALIPGGDDYLVFGCERSLWLLRGDAASGGEIDALSRADGVVSAQAWCMAPDRAIVFLGRDGLYRLSLGAGINLEPLSRDKLPRELANVDSNIYDVFMAFDLEGYGVHIWIVAKEGGRGRQHWWFDWSTQGFWPMSTGGVPAVANEPTAILDHPGLFKSDAGVLLGMRDGTIQQFNRLCALDWDQLIDSYVLYGPFRMADAPLEGIITRIVGTVGAASGQVKWSILPGDTVEEAREATAAASGYWKAGANVMTYPRVRAASFFIKLEAGEDYREWTVEKVAFRARLAGLHRLQAVP